MKTPVLFLDAGAGFGGDTRVLLDMLDALRGSAFEPWVALRRGASLDQALGDRVVNRVALDLLELGETSKLEFARRLSRAAIDLVRLCRREEIRVVHINRGLSGAHQLLGLTIRLASMGQTRLVYHGHTAPKRNLLTKATRQAASAIWAVSRFTAAQHIETGDDPSKVRLLYNAFRPLPEAKEATDWREILHLPETAFVIALVGRLSPNKGQHLAIEALTKLPTKRPIHLLLAGCDQIVDGNQGYRDQLIRQADELGVADRVHLLGHVEQPVSVFRSANLALVPSEEEAFGLSAIEAIASGTPVLASNRAGLREVVADVAGLPVCDRTPEALAAGIQEHLLSRVAFNVEQSATRLSQAFGFDQFRSTLLRLLEEQHDNHSEFSTYFQ